MQTKTYTVYKYDELTKEQQRKALDNLRDINVDHDWWDGTYSDANDIGLKITSFDLDRNRDITGELLKAAEDVAQSIIENHGEMCDTYKLATHYLKEVKTIPEGCTEGDGCEDCEAANEALEDDFLAGILEHYSQSLQTESEYLVTDEAIIETIEANDYDFTTEGKID